MQFRKFMPLSALLTVLATLAFVLSGVQAVHAQDTDEAGCDDPFAGVQIAFNPDFWELTDFCQHSVPYSEIRSGGPPPDGIPPIDNPQFESIASASEWLQPQSPVIVVEIDGDARAYPLSVLIWHEIANDELAGVPIAVTYCPLCNSAMVFDRRLGDETLRLGVSGNLRFFDMVMWDDVTESWWQQLTGEGIVGDYTGEQLTILPSRLFGFEFFVEQYPDGEVLSIPTNVQRDYGFTPYAGFDTGNYVIPEGEVLPLTERVLAGVVGDQPIAYPFLAISSVGAVNDTVGGEDVVVFWQSGATSAMNQAVIADSENVGMAAMYNRTVDEQVLTFTIDEDGIITDEETGTVWNMFGEAIDGELAGTALRQRLASPHFWFAWLSFYPETDIFGLELIEEELAQFYISGE